MKKIFVLPFLILMMTLSLGFSVKAAPSLDETVEFMVNGDNGWPHKKKWNIDQCVLTIIDDTKLDPWKTEKYNFNNVNFGTAKVYKQGLSSYMEASCNGDCNEYYNLGRNLVKRKDITLISNVEDSRLISALKNFIKFCPGFKSAF